MSREDMADYLGLNAETVSVEPAEMCEFLGVLGQRFTAASG